MRTVTGRRRVRRTPLRGRLAAPVSAVEADAAEPEITEPDADQAETAAEPEDSGDPPSDDTAADEAETAAGPDGAEDDTGAGDAPSDSADPVSADEAAAAAPADEEVENDAEPAEDPPTTSEDGQADELEDDPLREADEPETDDGDDRDDDAEEVGVGASPAVDATVGGEPAAASAHLAHEPEGGDFDFFDTDTWEAEPPAPRGRWKRVAGLSVAVALTFSAGLGLGYLGTDPSASLDYRELAEDLAELEDKHSDLQERYDTTLTDLRATQGRADEITKDLAETAAATGRTQSEMDAREAQLDERELAVADREQNTATAEQTLTQRLLAAAMIPDGTWLVGTEVAAGAYRAASPVGESCTWRIVGGGAADVDGSGVTPGSLPQVVLTEGRTFTTAGCGPWEQAPAAQQAAAELAGQDEPAAEQ